MKIIKTAQFEAMVHDQPLHGGPSIEDGAVDSIETHPGDEEGVDEQVHGPHDEDGSDLPILDHRQDENEEIDGLDDDSLDGVSGEDGLGMNDEMSMHDGPHGHAHLQLDMDHGIGGLPTELDIEPEAMPGFEEDLLGGGGGLDHMMGGLESIFDNELGGQHEMADGGNDIADNFGDSEGGMHDDMGLAGDYGDFDEMSMDGPLDGHEVGVHDSGHWGHPDGDFLGEGSGFEGESDPIDSSGDDDFGVAGDVEELHDEHHHGHHAHPHLSSTLDALEKEAQMQDVNCDAEKAKLIEQYEARIDFLKSQLRNGRSRGYGAQALASQQ